MRLTCRKIPKGTPIKTDLITVGAWQKGESGEVELTPLGRSMDRRLGGWIRETLHRERFEPRAGQARTFSLPKGNGAKVLTVIGLGEKGSFSPDVIQQGAAAAARAAGASRARSVSIEEASNGGRRNPQDFGEAAAEGALLGGYDFNLYKTERKGRDTPVEVVELLSPRADIPSMTRGVNRGRILAEAANLARDLINTPASDMTPIRLVREARKIARARYLSCRVLDRKACKRLGMGAFLAVAQGSDEPPYLIHMTYRPPGKKRRRVALVGKGITFDSGGLSLKTAQGMETMKFDMSGAAAVLAVMKALSELKPPIEVHGIAAVTENLPSGRAEKPGDIVRTLNGKTVEILNTDAEGRLTLADAIPYALRLKPDLVVDIATLTGACVVALGELCSGIMGNHQGLINQLIEAGKTSGETLWQLPLIEEYREELKSSFADIKNIGGKWGGTITAGLFLKEFVDPKVPWAHIDIAGPAWAEKETRLSPRGGTGAMVRTLIRFLLDDHPLSI